MATAVTYCSIQNYQRAVRIFATPSTCKEDGGPWCLHLHLARCQISNVQANDVIVSIFCTCNHGFYNRRGLFPELCLTYAVSTRSRTKPALRVPACTVSAKRGRSTYPRTVSLDTHIASLCNSWLPVAASPRPRIRSQKLELQETRVTVLRAICSCLKSML